MRFKLYLERLDNNTGELTAIFEESFATIHEAGRYVELVFNPGVIYTIVDTQTYRTNGLGQRVNASLTDTVA